MLHPKDQTLSADYRQEWDRQESRTYYWFMKMARSFWLYQVIRVLLGLLFFYSGVTKILHPGDFALVIEAYGLIPDFLVMPAAISLPLLEIMAALGLLKELKGSLSIITGLVILFMGVLGYGIYLGLDIDCGCFGPGDPEGEVFHSLRDALYKNFFLIGGIIYLYWYRIIRINRKNTFKYWFLQII